MCLNDSKMDLGTHIYTEAFNRLESEGSLRFRIDDPKDDGLSRAEYSITRSGLSGYDLLLVQGSEELTVTEIHYKTLKSLKKPLKKIFGQMEQDQWQYVE